MRENTDQNNSEFGYFSRSVNFMTFITIKSIILEISHKLFHFQKHCYDLHFFWWSFSIRFSVRFKGEVEINLNLKFFFTSSLSIDTEKYMPFIEFSPKQLKSLFSNMFNQIFINEMKIIIWTILHCTKNAFRFSKRKFNKSRILTPYVY